jgi:hypothetical protein
MSHSPDHPFGCPVTWGPVEALGGLLPPDMKLHICNEQGEDNHLHECKCGERLEGRGDG